MHDGVEQVESWKNTGGTPDATENPAGEVRLPMRRGHVARTMALAGLVLGISAISEAGALVTGPTSGP